MMPRLLFSIALALTISSAPAERDWGATLRQDASAMHDDIAANHPGPVNRRDPGFARRNDAQLALAVDRARTARSYADYFFAMMEYAASFNDGHVGFGAWGGTPNDLRWPGFLTGYDGRGEQRVVIADPGSPVPVGAKLIGCDGQSADRLAAERLGRMWGRWQLESQRQEAGFTLFIDEANRYVRRQSRCVFTLADGVRTQVVLDWRPIAMRDLFARRARVTHPLDRQFEARTLPDGSRWYAMPSFNGEPGSRAGKALPALIAGMRADRAALAAAPAIILDLRGNDGGSSDWSHQIAQALWGDGRLARLRDSGTAVDWRVSPANLAALEEGYGRRKASLSPEAERWYTSVIAGLKAALKRGDLLWHQHDEPDNAMSGTISPSALPRLRGPIYVVIDGACASACLDAIDLWRALGAVHIGRTTSADTLYMDVRQVHLPSGITGVSVPMKVYRGRPRGDNVPVVPVHRFPGDITDTPALERWIASLPR